MSNNEPSFSLYEFKDWMSKQEHSNFFERKMKEEKNHEFIGEQAFAKVSKSRLMKRATVDEDTEDVLEDIIDEFMEDGGFVSDVDGKMLMIEVGTNFNINLPRFCVKIRKTK